MGEAVGGQGWTASALSCAALVQPSRLPLFFIFRWILFGNRWELGVALLRDLREVGSLSKISRLRYPYIQPRAENVKIAGCF